MPRSLRAWLASLALIAFPNVALPSFAHAQNFMGPPYLAPVALEARCTLLDDLSGAIAGLTALGADPLASAILVADAAASRPSAADAVSSPRRAAADGGPAETRLRNSLAELAAEEPVDVAAPWVGCGGMISEIDRAADAEPATTARASDSSKPIEGGTAIDEVLAGCGGSSCDAELAGCGEWACEEELAAAAEAGAAEAGCAEGERAVAAADAVAHGENGSRFVGSSPVITTLEEEYLPYDVKADEPLRLRLLPFSVRRSCSLANGPSGAPAAAAEAVADVPAAAAAPVVKLIPSHADWIAARRWVDSLQPRMPVNCWMEEVVWQVSDAMDPQGPIRRGLEAERIGSHLGHWALRFEQRVLGAAQPVMPILARVPASRQQPVAAPAGLPPQPNAAEPLELAVAADALHSAAGGLESLAAALRSWGTSLDRVAKAPPRLHAPVQR